MTDPSPHHVVTTCVCGAPAHAYLYVGAKNGYAVGTCDTCGTTRTLTRAPEYERLYTDGDLYHGDHQRAEGHVPYEDRYEHDFNLAVGARIPKLLLQHRSLDVGCANGAFVAAMRSRGFQAEGLEINPVIAERAAARTRCPIYTSWAQVPRHCYAVVTYHDVFEHVVDPRAELDHVRTAMMFGGLLVVDVPDRDDPRAATMDWHHWRPEQHLWHWREATLVPLLEGDGWYICDVQRPIPGKLVVYARPYR